MKSAGAAGACRVFSLLTRKTVSDKKHIRLETAPARPGSPGTGMRLEQVEVDRKGIARWWVFASTARH
jgi:hypothetical protein